MPQVEPEMMQCMEVWGGNRVTDHAVSMAGLDAWIYAKPHGESEEGGDVYYVSSCATGRISRLLIADVSGHGSGVGEMAVQLRQLMRRYVNFLDQTKFVSSMNQQFGTLAKVGCFATAIVTTFFAPNGRMSLCNAGHPPPLMYRARTKQWTYLEQEASSVESTSVSNVPLGIMDITEYEQFEVVLEAGDQVLCYTDSLIECKREDGEMLGTGGLLRVIRTIECGEPKAFIAKLLDAIAKLRPGNLSDDDVTAMLFKPNALTAVVPFKQRLLAPMLVLKGMVRSLLQSGVAMPRPEMNVPNTVGALVSPLERLWHGRRGGTPRA